MEREVLVLDRSKCPNFKKDGKGYKKKHTHICKACLADLPLLFERMHKGYLLPLNWLGGGANKRTEEAIKLCPNLALSKEPQKESYFK